MYLTYINDVENVIVLLLMQCINSNKKYQKIHVCSFICVMKCLGLCSYCVRIHRELPDNLTRPVSWLDNVHCG